MGTGRGGQLTGNTSLNNSYAEHDSVMMDKLNLSKNESHRGDQGAHNLSMHAAAGRK